MDERNVLNFSTPFHPLLHRNQLRAAASELEEIRAEILTANNLCDSELRSQLQQANDEIYKLRNQLSECAERKVNKMDKKDLLNL